ncbi:MAG: hypothetical protein OEQ29_01980 [Alphaproteobacteria bacterium]|nr:hypothetical protein [Alphaproteobacteria bacterium]
MLKRLAAAIVVATLAVAGAARADKVTDAIERASKAYGDGKLSSTSRELQFAIGRISRRLAKVYGEAMPPAPDGWKARRARTRQQGIGMMGLGISVQRRYRPDGGGRGRASAQLVVDNPMMQAMGAMFANPAMAQSSGYERLEVKGQAQPGFIKFDEDRKRGDAIILIGGRVFLKVEAMGVENEDVLRALVAGWNIKRIKEIAEIP